jgi:hypothetical protein
MPALASHRRLRSRSAKPSPAVGFTTAALAGVTLLSTQSATAAPSDPKPSIEEVQKKVDDLYRQAGSATQEYNKAKEATAEKRREVDTLFEEAATRAEKLNESRRALGAYAAAQYRTGAVTPTAALLFADSPQAYFDQTQLMDRMTDQQRTAVSDYETQRAAAAKQRAEATKRLESLTESQQALRISKQNVQTKLAEARTLLRRPGRAPRPRRSGSAGRATSRPRRRAPGRRTARTRPGPTRSSPSPAPRSASRTCGGRPARPRTTARGSPKGPGRRRAWICRAPPGTR